MRVGLLGTEVDALGMDATVDRLEELLDRGAPAHHVCVNAAKVVQLQRDPDLRDVVAAADVVSADGMSVVWAARVLGRPVPGRVPGIDLMDALLARAARRGWSVFFLGATPEIVQRTVEVELGRHPGLVVAGHRDGYWSPGEEDEVVATVAAAAPTILLLGIPSPRKEQFAARHRHALGAGLVLGVGGSFDVVAGTVRRAPVLLQRAGLEWAFRLAQEPRRMWRRYLVGNARFGALVVRELVEARA